MPRRRRPIDGFTLTELMIIVAIVGVLTLIAVPKFSSLIRRANESGSKGHLGSVRGAIRLYYMEQDQTFPTSFLALQQAGSKYFTGSIPLFTGEHPVTSLVDDVAAPDPSSDAGRWAYVSAGPDMGFFWIQCTHTDTTGRVWSSY